MYRPFDCSQLIRVSNEPAVHVRTRAMKALSSIVAADPGILSRVNILMCIVIIIMYCYCFKCCLFCVLLCFVCAVFVLLQGHG